MAVDVFGLNGAKSGKITFTPPGTYAAQAGALNCETGQDVEIGKNWRAFFCFDTSSIPGNALITGVEFQYIQADEHRVGAPQYYNLKVSIGTFIGEALNGTQQEFDAGTLTLELTELPPNLTWLNLDGGYADPIPHVNRDGDTDIKVWDDSISGTGDTYWHTVFNTIKAECRLRITYVVPSGTATGKGTATCTFVAHTTVSFALNAGTREVRGGDAALRDAKQTDHAHRHVRPTDQAYRQVPGAHEATLACAPEHTKAHGPRRSE